MKSKEPGVAKRASKALLKMVKFEVAALERAAKALTPMPAKDADAHPLWLD